MYYEADCKIELKPGFNKHPFNHVDLGFDHKPSYLDVKEELAERYPEFKLIRVNRVWNAQGKVDFMKELYSKPFSGD